LGAAKCGTSSLHGYLGQHPEICVSNPKEPFFFEAEFDRGPTYYFNRYFTHWSGEPIVGEARHRNLYMPYTPERIFRYNPEARLIVCVRNPVERAASHWWHWYSRGIERASFRESIEMDWERIQAGVTYEDPAAQEVYARTLDPGGKGALRTYLDSGYYFDQVLRFLARFPAERLQIILLEDITRDPQRVTSGLLQFLGTTRLCPIDYAPLNQSEPGALQHLDRSTVAWLVEHYRPHNRRLAEYMGRGLDEWDLPFRNLFAKRL
jgi:hypothetical protein